MGRRGHIFDVESARDVSRVAELLERPGGMDTTGGALSVPQQQRVQRARSSGALLVEMEVQSESADTLTCKRVDPTDPAMVTTFGDPVEVAKPYQLRRTPFDGETVTFPDGGVTFTYTADNKRDATDGTDMEEQEVTPFYYTGELLICAFMVTGLAADMVPVRYADINTAGRAWAAVPEEPAP